VTGWKKPDFYEGRPDVAEKALAIALGEGQVTLALGAGASKTMGFPAWSELANAACVALLKEKPDLADVITDTIDETWDTERMLLRMQHVRDALKDDTLYHDTITKCLYAPLGGDIPDKPSGLLKALGSLMRRSRRGRVRCVVTLNFDCLLESYLRKQGLLVQVIETFPKLFIDSDVSIFHPHGYLPSNPKYGTRSNDIIFDQRAVEQRILEKPAGWNDAFRYLAGSSVFIAVGLSGRDPLHRLILTACQQQRRSTNVTGFWYMRDAPEDFDKDLINNLHSSGVAVLKVSDHSEIEDSLWRIRNYAGGEIYL
jgi:hypothetical protein